MIVCLENLQAGVNWWLTSTPNWGVDIMNSEYREIYRQRAGGVTEVWWESCVKRLWDWKAIRSRNPPNTKDEIKRRGLDRLEGIAREYHAVQSLFESEPTILEVSWEQIRELFRISSEIKWGERRNASPVFACKMCHFLFPKVFPVIDNFATGIFEYEFYWRGMKDEWQRFPSKEEALATLLTRVEAVGPAHCLYPWETKIMELCHVGYAHG